MQDAGMVSIERREREGEREMKEGGKRMLVEKD